MRNLIFFLLGFIIPICIGMQSAHAAWCTTIGTNNDLVVSSASPDTAATISACTGPVVLQQSEYQSLTAQAAIWSLDAAGATQIGSAIVLIWGLAWTFRVLIRMFNSRSLSIDSQEE